MNIQSRLRRFTGSTVLAVTAALAVCLPGATLHAQMPQILVEAPALIEPLMFESEFSPHAELSHQGRREQPALIISEQPDSIAEAYLVVVSPQHYKKMELTLIAGLEQRGLKAAGALAEVIEEAIGLGAAIHGVDADAPGSFIATLDRRSRNWVANHPAVDFLQALTPGELARLVDEPSFGGREQVAAGIVPKGWTDTRILVNGGILGWGVNGYRQPYISNAGNMVGHAAEMLRRLKYSVSWNANTQTMHAHRDNSSNVAGALEIRLTHDSRWMVLREVDAHGYIATRNVLLPEAARVESGVMVAPARAVMQAGGVAIIDWDQSTRSMQTYFYEELDVGIYFLGVQQNATRTDQPGAQKYIPGQPNPFFNPNRPTIIYAHGWQRNGVINRDREGLLFTHDNQWQNVQNYWITRGWNVGMFQWVQLADDDWGAKPVDTEKKIYDANSFNVGMRWKRTSGNFSNVGRPTLNVTQLYRQHYLQVANALSPNVEIRLIGNSLGGNLTVNMVRELIINGSRVPIRVTLQDPYWDSNLGGINLPAGFNNTRAVAVNGAQRIEQRGLALEYFRSSVFGQQGYTRGVALMSSYVNFVPGYTANPIAKHTQPTRQYLWGYDFPGTVASARTPHVTVRARMTTELYWNHVVGTHTATPGDDAFVTVHPKP